MATNNAINNTLAEKTIFAALESKFNGTPLNDNLGFKLFNFNTSGGTPVNFIQVINGNTGFPPYFKGVGTDTNVSLLLDAQGTGGVQIKGTGTNDSAAAGHVGQVISSNITLANAVTVASAATANITSIVLTAGDWDVWGNVVVQGTTVTTIQAAIHSVSATLPDGSLTSYISPLATSGALGVPVPQITVQTTGATYYLVINPFGTGTITCSGNIYARRVR